ncbi:hypothetical protein N657DRAFT_154460 [Parathielavia appendiculata]|uniref:Uncharacterized protein n=1 Tax=Parathielavia appendiculata TaxID=2587402 RepID=A0AAN6TTM3_9PEZI|nr:hypothetical protein N657DRAFT_154460 [Parathielavia appendiculata]
MLPNRVAAHSCPGSASQPRCGAACQVSDGLKRTDWLLGTPAPASQIPYFPRPQQARPLTPRPNQKRAVSPNPTPATSQRTVPEYTWCQWQQYGRFPVLRSSTAHVLQSHASILCCALRSDDPLPPQTTPKRCTARRIDGAGAVAVRAAQFTAWNVRPNRIRRANPATHKVPAAKTRRGLRVLPVVRLS